MLILYYIILYSYIGYTYACWVNYRRGAGFETNKYIYDLADDFWPLFMILWPILMLVHLFTNMYTKFNLERVTNVISPDSFYNRGQHDDDIDKQAEKHLLGGK